MTSSQRNDAAHFDDPASGAVMKAFEDDPPTRRIPGVNSTPVWSQQVASKMLKTPTAYQQRAVWDPQKYVPW